MTQDNVIKLAQPGTFSDPLTEILRNGARALLAHAVEAEVAGFLGDHADKLTADGRARLVRHGHLPEREIVTGIGPVAVRCPRVRDRAADGGERIRFSSAILPPYARRSKSLEVLIPILYLKGVSTGDFEEALVALLAGASATSRPNATSTFGPMASTCRPGSKTRASACWSSSAPHRKARRNSSVSSMACARAHNPGRSCSSTLSGADYRWVPSWRSPMARSAFGKPSKRYGPTRVGNAAGCTRPPMSSTSCRRASNLRPSEHCKKSGWPRPRRMRSRRSMPSSRPGASNTRRRSSA